MIQLTDAQQVETAMGLLEDENLIASRLAIVGLTGLTISTVSQTLLAMMDAGQIHQVVAGVYALTRETVMTEEQLEEIHRGLTEEQFAQLADSRGGCSCWRVQAPCGNCTKPLTQAEAEELGLIPEDHDATGGEAR